MNGLALNREWRMRALAAALAGVGAVVAPVWYLGAVAPVDAYFARPIYPDQVFAALLAIALLALAGWQAFVAMRERERARLRAAVIVGNTSAMPRARLTRDWFDAHMQRGVPVVVEWRRHRIERFVWAPFLGLILGCGFVGIAAFPVGIFFQLATYDLKGLAPLFAPTNGHPGTGLPMTLGICLGIIPFGFAIMRNGWRAMFQHVTIEANDEGVRWRGGWGRERLISWQDARLFEVSTFRRFDFMGRSWDTVYRYSLYSRDTAIRWDSAAGPLTRDMRRELSHLLYTISQHPGLTPRTANPTLTTRATPEVGGLRGLLCVRGLENARLGVFAGFWLCYSLALLILVIVAPPTASLSLNIVIALSLLGMAAFVTWSVLAYLRAARALWRRTKEEVAARHGGRTGAIPFPSVMAVAVEEHRMSQANAANWQRKLWFYRVGMLLLTAALSADGIPAIAALWFRGAWPGTSIPLVLPGYDTVIAYLLTLHAVVGLIGFPVCLVVMVLVARGTIGDSFWMIPPS